MEKKYILTEMEMRKILLHLDNSIVPKVDYEEEGSKVWMEREICSTNHTELLEDIENMLNINSEYQYIDPVTLEIKVWGASEYDNN